MKRLLSIMLMNAWGGLLKKASLSTISLVGISVIGLLVVSTVTADASPHANIPVVRTVANVVSTSITDPISSFLSDPTPPSKPVTSKKHKAHIGGITTSGVQQPTPATSNAGSVPTSGASSSSSTSNSASQTTNSQPATVAIAASALKCIPNTSANSYTVNVTNAQLNFQTPPTAGGTITYEWDILSDNGQVTVGTTIGQQQFTTGQTDVSLVPNQSSYLYTTNSNASSYSFRLHITGPINVTSSWISVPMTADGSCPSSYN